MKSKALLINAAVVLTMAVTVSWLVGTSGAQGMRVGQSAPEITGGPWINSEPLSMEKLRGRVVLVEFWTFG